MPAAESPNPFILRPFDKLRTGLLSTNGFFIPDNHLNLFQDVFLFPPIFTELAAGTHIVCLYDTSESPPLPPTAEAIPLFVFPPDIHRIVGGQAPAGIRFQTSPSFVIPECLHQESSLSPPPNLTCHCEASQKPRQSRLSFPRHAHHGGGHTHNVCLYDTFLTHLPRQQPKPNPPSRAAQSDTYTIPARTMSAAYVLLNPCICMGIINS